MQLLVALGGIVLLAGVYLLLMRLTIDVSRLERKSDASMRDLVYLGLHTGLLAVAAVLGFAAGKWLNGMGVGYGLLFLVVLLVWMLAAQLGAYGLACHGHNDLIRHWTC
ncbi:MAG: hypothetical protein IT304_11005 [Dehalococcoidia bacterium]|nr:hypothetical protein [Dehalococcoidia bacterium]